MIADMAMQNFKNLHKSWPSILQATGKSRIVNQIKQVHVKWSNSPEVVQSITTGEIDKLKNMITQQNTGWFELLKFKATRAHLICGHINRFQKAAKRIWSLQKSYVWTCKTIVDCEQCPPPRLETVWGHERVSFDSRTTKCSYRQIHKNVKHEVNWRASDETRLTLLEQRLSQRAHSWWLVIKCVDCRRISPANTSQ